MGRKENRELMQDKDFNKIFGEKEFVVINDYHYHKVAEDVPVSQEDLDPAKSVPLVPIIAKAATVKAIRSDKEPLESSKDLNKIFGEEEYIPINDYHYHRVTEESDDNTAEPDEHVPLVPIIASGTAVKSGLEKAKNED